MYWKDGAINRSSHKHKDFKLVSLTESYVVNKKIKNNTRV